MKSVNGRFEFETIDVPEFNSLLLRMSTTILSIPFGVDRMVSRDEFALSNMDDEDYATELVTTMARDLGAHCTRVIKPRSPYWRAQLGAHDGCSPL